MSTSPVQRESVSGIEVMRGIGVQRAKPFWADAWDRTISRRGAQLATAWIGLIALFAVIAPVVASGLPLWSVEAKGGVVVRSWSPLWEHLTATDLLMLLGGVVGIPLVFLARWRTRGARLGLLCTFAVQAGLSVVVAGAIREWLVDDTGSEWVRSVGRLASTAWIASGLTCGVLALACFRLAPLGRPKHRTGPRLAWAGAVALVCTAAIASRWIEPVALLDRYVDEQASGVLSNTWAPIPFGPDQSRTDCYMEPPGTTFAQATESFAGTALGEREFVLGTDTVGKDVLSQMLHACRLSISIGFVSTSISLIIGVTLGALMGYFGGRVDMALSRVVEIFMAIPVLFLLIVAAAVLPRNTYVMMAIIGCVSWPGPARFIRAEFLKLRNTDFVQAARALGLPLHTILFKHMLTNGVTPVLVQASFAIAAAILAEATLSFLGLGPVGQASWGKLLASATGETGQFIWWLAIFPGLAIFLTVLAYNLLGEALRDAIDPKLRKAAL
ncbi:MAG: ABC transporter permease [Planctomycetota bacterium]|nr:ABC transporter permease [Planctomycetota bacterium]